jgi:hypothetical protein
MKEDVYPTARSYSILACDRWREKILGSNFLLKSLDLPTDIYVKQAGIDFRENGPAQMAKGRAERAGRLGVVTDRFFRKVVC